MSAAAKCRLVPRVESYPSWVRLAQQPLGKAALLAVFAAGLYLHGRSWWLEMTAIFAVIGFWPARRRLWIVLATSYWWWRHTPLRWSLVIDVAQREGVAQQLDWGWLRLGAIAAALAFCAAYLYAARARERIPAMRRPVACLLASYVAMLAIAAHAPLPGELRCALWAFVVVLGRCLWFLAYSLLYPEPQRSPLMQVGHYVPFWLGTASTPNPFPKAGGYLAKIEVKDAGEQAVWQIKAVKLLVWAGVLVTVRKLWREFHLDWVSLPSLFTLLTDSLAGHAHGVVVSWLALLERFLLALLDLSIWGHLVVACCRMAGFKALRNTYRPLTATSIAEFWNRYYFYFKELLADVFFYPTFLRYFRGHPRLRRLFATLAAASFGNFLLHYLRDLELIAHGGLGGALVAKRFYAMYALLLGLAIGVSQLRAQSGSRWRPGRVEKALAPLIVIGFYCVLQVFEVEARATIAQRFAFLLTLIGIRP